MSRAPTTPRKTRSNGVSAARAAEATLSFPYHTRSTKLQSGMRALGPGFGDRHRGLHLVDVVHRIAGAFRADVHGVAVCDAHFRERTRNLETIPTSQTPGSARPRRGADHRGSGARGPA